MKQISKLISYWLRHHPEDAGLEVDDFGWTSTEGLIEALRERQFEIDLTGLVTMNRQFDKIRWEIDEAGGRIRATHGHSITVLLEDKARTPPAVLYHGTAESLLPAIKATGLLPMKREFVHLSSNKETALKVGARHGKPILIEVASGRLSGDGRAFYHTSDEVWLTRAVPVEYLQFTM